MKADAKVKESQKKNPRVDFFFAKAGQWQEEYEKLRTIALASGLNETLKWGHPCYTLANKNVVLIHGFKEYCALLFFKGALLKDTRGILVQQTENVQSARQIRFSGVREIVKMQSVLKTYIKEAIEVENAGLKVTFKKSTEYKVPEELGEKLKTMPALKKAFYALTPGRQRAYLLYFGSAKQATTRESRVQRYLKQILAGKGLDD